MKSAIKNAKGAEALGRVVARVLRGSWRKDPPSADLDAETLAQILPLLTAGGVAGLAWRRVRGTAVADSEPGQQLQSIHRYGVLRNAVHARDLKKVISLLDARAIEAVLVKGWSLGPLYPELGLRMFGDIDLCIRPSDAREARLFLREGYEGIDVDLHAGFGKFYETRTEELFARSQLGDLDDCKVRVLKFEDHFRFLCLHLLRHGGNRPLWLCDIAAALEAMPDDFDWDLCLSDGSRQAELVTGAIGIAHRILEARIDHVPMADRARRVPQWMVSTVLAEWSVPYKLQNPLASYQHHPIGLFKELPRHWPNAIEATINVGGRFNERPRWPLQVADVIAKTWEFLTGSRGLPGTSS